MAKENQTRKTYASDLTEAQWAIVEPMIPPAKQGKRGGRPRQVDMREVLNTIFYLNRSGCQWEMLPHDLSNLAKTSFPPVRKYPTVFRTSGEITLRRVDEFEEP